MVELHVRTDNYYCLFMLISLCYRVYVTGTIKQTLHFGCLNVLRILVRIISLILV